VSEISMVNVKEKFDEYKNKIADEFGLNNKEEKEKMSKLEKELDNIDISSKSNFLGLIKTNNKNLIKKILFILIYRNH